MESHWHVSDLQYSLQPSPPNNNENDKQQKHECQRMIKNLIKITEHLGEWSSCDGDFATQVLIGTEKCAQVWDTDKNKSMSAIRTNFKQFVGPVRTQRLLDSESTSLDKHIACSAFKRYSKDITTVSVSLLTPEEKMSHYMRHPLMVFKERP